MIVKHMHECIKTVAEILFKKTVKEEVAETCKAKNLDKITELTVSGDGTWKKRGFSSLFGVSSIIGYYTGKVIDVFVKSSYCKVCEFWNKKEGSEEYEEWLSTHTEECHANHQGSSGKMEVEAIIEMFQRSEKNYGVKYMNYIGDGDSKTYMGIINAAPYGDTSIIKKECIGHVQKRMGSRLREYKKKRRGSAVKAS